MNVAMNLTKYIKDANISLNEFSQRVSISPSTIHGWLNGVPPKNINDLKKIAEYFNVSLDELCFGDVKKSNETNVVISIGSDSYKVILKRV
jgi:transcriptional regulator with XRE-family HTH domain